MLIEDIYSWKPFDCDQRIREEDDVEKTNDLRSTTVIFSEIAKLSLGVKLLAKVSEYCRAKHLRYVPITKDGSTGCCR